MMAFAPLRATGPRAGGMLPTPERVNRAAKDCHKYCQENSVNLISLDTVPESQASGKRPDQPNVRRRLAALRGGGSTAEWSTTSELFRLSACFFGMVSSFA